MATGAVAVVPGESQVESEPCRLQCSDQRLLLGQAGCGTGKGDLENDTIVTKFNMI